MMSFSRSFKLIGWLWGAIPAALIWGASPGNASGADPQKLLIFQGHYPRAFFFRQCEIAPSMPGFDFTPWDATYSGLMGIMGKAADEEIPKRAANPPAFTEFKAAHPDQMVVLHFNGEAADPDSVVGKRFSAGHWIYFNGATVLSDVPAEPGETTISVSDARLFRINIGRFRNKNDDIGLCVTGTDGRPDWTRSEQVTLIATDVKTHAIRVRRGCHGTRPMAFQAGHAYAAAHFPSGPWDGPKGNLQWVYNYSLTCPRDAKGRTCADVLTDYIAESFAPGGPFAAFDGLEFDVMMGDIGGPKGLRGLDVNNDGKVDGGWVDGVNIYGAGMIEFCRELRKRLGDDRLIMADGGELNEQRAFGLLNGIESEGWPTGKDWAVQGWSTGLNTHFFWQANARPPALNYINHKYVERDNKGNLSTPNVPLSIDRLVFAAAVFTDSGITYALVPPSGTAYPKRGDPGIWDELNMGAEHRLGWLGHPVGPARHLASEQPDLLKGAGSPVTRAFASRFQSTDARMEVADGALKIVANDPKAKAFTVRFTGIDDTAPDIYISMTASGEPMAREPVEMARLFHARLSPAGSAEGAKLPEFFSRLNGKEFTSGFFFDGKPPGAALDITFESAEPVRIQALSIHAYPDVMLREFQHGLVVANPSSHPFTFDLAKLCPGEHFRRFRGTPAQDPKTNNGARVESSLTLGPKDALFLVKE